MERPLEEILEDSLAVAEQQLTAARALDVEALREATNRRQDLNFELELIEAEELDIRGDTLIEGLLLDLQQIDRRITAVVGAANAVFSTLIPREPPPTYSATGRLRGGAA
jgi:hypothetical protein